MNTREKPQWQAIKVKIKPMEGKAKRLIMDFEKKEKLRNEDKEKIEKFWSEFYLK